MMRLFMSNFSEHGITQVIPKFFLVAEIVNKTALTSFHKYCCFLKSKVLMFSNINFLSEKYPRETFLAITFS